MLMMRLQCRGQRGLLRETWERTPWAFKVDNEIRRPLLYLEHELETLENKIKVGVERMRVRDNLVGVFQANAQGLFVARVVEMQRGEQKLDGWARTHSLVDKESKILCRKVGGPSSFWAASMFFDSSFCNWGALKLEKFRCADVGTSERARGPHAQIIAYGF
jgi:hypothetical protein